MQNRNLGKNLFAFGVLTAGLGVIGARSTPPAESRPEAVEKDIRCFSSNFDSATFGAGAGLIAASVIVGLSNRKAAKESQ